MPAATFCWPQQAFSTRNFCFLSNFLQDPRGLVPPKRTGGPLAADLAAANQVRVRPCLAALRRVRTRPLMAAPRALAHPFVVVPRPCARSLAAASRLHAQPFPCGGVSRLRPGRQRLEFSGGGSLSPACRLDASGSFGQGQCSAHDQQCFPSFARVNVRGFDFPCVRFLGHGSKSKRVDVIKERRWAARYWWQQFLVGERSESTSLHWYCSTLSGAGFYCLLPAVQIYGWDFCPNIADYSVQQIKQENLLYHNWYSSQYRG